MVHNARLAKVRRGRGRAYELHVMFVAALGAFGDTDHGRHHCRVTVKPRQSESATGSEEVGCLHVVVPKQRLFFFALTLFRSIAPPFNCLRSTDDLRRKLVTSIVEARGSAMVDNQCTLPPLRV